MLDLVIIAIIVIAVFIGAVWYAKRSSQQRKALLDDINNIEPEMGDSSQFADVFDQEMEQQTIDSERFDIDAEPTVTFSDDVAATQPKPTPQATADIKKDEAPVSNSRIDDVIDDDFEVSDLAEPQLDVETHVEPPPVAEVPQDSPVDAVVEDWKMVVAFTIMARGEALFSGKSIKIALETLDLHFGDMQIYHRQVPGLRTQTVFSVANILDPGTLNPDSFATMKTPGLLIFARLPGPINGLALFDDLLDTAQKMADKLDGVLSDEAREPVNQATIEAMRSRILNLNMQIQAEESNHYNNDY